ncbi:MAG TPA: cytochrome c maturation protein CcmE, partial [Abditibacteriaceae bacterium]
DALPDTFRAGGPVQVDGTYAAPGSIEAEHVLTKCPSKYEEAKPAPGTKNGAKPYGTKPYDTKPDGAKAGAAKSAQSTPENKDVAL